MLFMIPWTVAGSPDRKEMHDSRIHETSQEHQGDEILSRSLQIVAAGGFVNRYIRPNIKQILLIRRTDAILYEDSIADVFYGSFNSFFDAETSQRYSSCRYVDILHKVGKEYEAMMKWKAL